MAMVLIDFDLPDFQDSFAWEGDENTAQRAAEAARQVTTRGGIDPPDEYMLRTLVQANPRTREGTQAVITAFVLQLPTQDVDRPGVIGDYFAACDVAVTIRETAGRFIYRVGFAPQKDIADVA